MSRCSNAPSLFQLRICHVSVQRQAMQYGRLTRGQKNGRMLENEAFTVRYVIPQAFGAERIFSDTGSLCPTRLAAISEIKTQASGTCHFRLDKFKRDFHRFRILLPTSSRHACKQGEWKPSRNVTNYFDQYIGPRRDSGYSRIGNWLTRKDPGVVVCGTASSTLLVNAMIGSLSSRVVYP